MTARHPLAARLALALGACLVALALAEAWVRLADPLPHLRAIVEARDGGSPVGSRALHPYLGWSWRPNGSSERFATDSALFADGGRPADVERNSRTNALGYRSPIWDYRSVRDEDFVIGIFGGSVASDLAILASAELAARVAEREPSLDGSVVVLNFGVPAYKQPQQLIALNLAVLLGIPLDAVVNLDGFNEVVFGRLNAAARYHPLFPAKGQYSVAAQLQTRLGTESALIRMGDIARARQAGDAIVDRLCRSETLRRSALLRTLAGALASQQYRRADSLQADLGRANRKTVSPALAELSEPCIEAGRACYGPLSDIWQRSSELMHALSRSVGAHYIHVLQPSQYVDGSKTLTVEELERAYDLDSHYAKHLPGGYRLLRNRGERLRRKGIDFHDLTMSFAEVAESIYVDRCCHLNPAGHGRIARTIGDLVAEAITRARSPSDRETP